RSPHYCDGAAQNIRVSNRSELVRRIALRTNGGIMKYLTFIRHSESHRQSGPPAALMEAMGKFVQKSLKDGSLVDTGGLLPSKDGFRVRLPHSPPPRPEGEV